MRLHRQVGARLVPERGFAMLMVVFVLVIASGLVLTVAALYERGSVATTLAIRQARAVAAAQAALEWAAVAVHDPADPTAATPDQFPPCWGAPMPVPLPGSLAEFTVTVACRRWPEGSGPGATYEEDVRQVVIYRLQAEAVAGAPESSERVVRRMELQLERCKDPVSTLPEWAC